MQTIKYFIVTILLTSLNGMSQESGNANQHSKQGFNFGIGIGYGLISGTMNDSSFTQGSASLPNIKIGYMIKENLSLQLVLPGATYAQNDSPRGFEGVLLSAQWWPKNKWWIQGAAGMTFDAPAFWTVENPSEAQFFTGFPALSFGTGFEIIQRRKFTLDAQYRIFYGQTNRHDTRELRGMSNMIIIGFNWY